MNTLGNLNRNYKYQPLIVKTVERMQNSRNGNPRYRFLFANGKHLTTPVDAGWVYEIVPQQWQNSVVIVVLKSDSNGKSELDHIKYVCKHEELAEAIKPEWDTEL